MAYPTIDAPYGFKPVNLIGGQVYAGSTRNIPIAYNAATPIYNGDFVNIVSGFCANVANTLATPTVGVFLGCFYTLPATKQRIWAQFYPGGITSGDITAIVADDPDTVFRVAVTAAAASAVLASASPLNLGANMAGGTVAGSANTGNSNGAVVALATTAGNFRVMELVTDTQTSVPAVYISGTGTTTLTMSGLLVGTFLPIGTAVWQVVGGQLQFTGSALTAATTVTSATSQALTVTASTVTVSGTLALIQTPEVLVKITFGSHRYYVA
jgi:hypothetical protein